MKKIPLTQGQFAIVDDHWFEYLSQWNWCALWSEKIQSYYAVRNEGPRKNQKMILMHRVVANTPIGMQCDHISHNTLDNRESELRNVTNSQNKMNTKVQKNNKLGIKGVCKRTGRNSYYAIVYSGGKLVFKKSFKTIEDAKKAYEDASKIHHGDFRNKE